MSQQLVIGEKKRLHHLLKWKKTYKLRRFVTWIAICILLMFLLSPIIIAILGVVGINYGAVLWWGSLLLGLGIAATVTYNIESNLNSALDYASKIYQDNFSPNQFAEKHPEISSSEATKIGFLIERNKPRRFLIVFLLLISIFIIMTTITIWELFTVQQPVNPKVVGAIWKIVGSILLYPGLFFMAIKTVYDQESNLKFVLKVLQKYYIDEQEHKE